jgi:hypothetical protein
MEKSTLYDKANGNPVTGYLLLKSQGKNVPLNWVKVYSDLRKAKHDDVVDAIEEGLAGYSTLLEWEEAYKKECFYYGIRALLELDRNGKTDH